MKHTSILLVLVIFMILTVFAGCTHTEPTAAPTAAPTIAPVPTETKAPEKTGIFPLEERKTFQIYVMTDNDWQANLEVNGWYHDLVERTNVEIEFIPLGTDKIAAVQAFNDALMSGNYGNAFIGSVLTPDQVVSVGKAGYLKPLEPFMTEEIMPGYMSVLNTIPGALETMRCTDGNIYTMACLTNQGPNSYIESPLMINQQWMEAAGLSDVNTIEKFEKYLKYVKDADCNNNGDPNDEIPFLVCATSSLEAQATLQGIMNWWGIGTKDSANDLYIVIRDGKAQLAPTMPEYRAALTKVKEWIDAGYIWDQFFTGKTAAMKSLVLDADVPVVGCVNTNAWEPFDAEKYGDMIPGNGINDDGYYTFVSVPVPEGYTPSMYVEPGYLGSRDAYAILGNTSDEDAKIILAWMDAAMWTLEGSAGSTGSYWKQNEYVQGWNNTYKKDDTGKLVKIELTEAQIMSNKDLEKTLPAGYTLYDICGSYTYCYPLSYYEEVPSRRAFRFREMGDIYTDYVNEEIWSRPYKTPDQSDRITLLWPYVKAVITQYETEFLQGKLELNDTNWEEYQNALLKAGSEDLVQVIQSTIDAVAGK